MDNFKRRLAVLIDLLKYTGPVAIAILVATWVMGQTYAQSETDIDAALIAEALRDAEQPGLELTPAAISGLEAAREWMRSGERPIRDHEGSVVYRWGASLPEVVCAPYYTCAVLLEAGERVLQVDIGDSERWRVTPTVFVRDGDEITALMVKPERPGIHTSMSVATDRRLYSLALQSTESDWMPRVAFAYPDRIDQRWQEYFERQELSQDEAVLGNGLLIENLSFDYRISGAEVEWRPIRVYDDGERTYMAFAAGVLDRYAPVLAIASAAGDPELIDYRVLDDRYVVETLVERAWLNSGEFRVEINWDGETR